MNDYNNSSFNQNSDGGSFHNMSTSEYINAIASSAGSENTNSCFDNYSYTNNSDDYNNTYGDNVKTLKKKSKAGKFIKKVSLITASAVLFGSVAGVMFNVVDDYMDDKDDVAIEKQEDYVTEGNEDYVTTEFSGSSIIETVSTVDNSSYQGMDVSSIAENVMPSIVAITIKSVEEYGYGFFGQTYEYESEGSGSGIIIGENDTELLIVTNNHVVSDADTVSVSFIDDSVYDAKVKGTDSDSDLAIIVVDLDDLSEDTKAAIKVAKLGSSEELKVGEQVVAIGNALGYGQSVTTGIVSALNRVNSTNSTPLIQTDAAINPGNSGGALLNMNGEVIGINSSKYASTDVEGMGYAIPISEVENILEDLMNRETREKVDEERVGYLGVGCATVSEEASLAYSMPQGALVSEVKSGSPAEKAGIKRNNIITEFDGIDITSAEQLVELLEYYEAGESVTVTVAYLDDDEYVEKEIEVVLGRRAAASN